MLSNAIDIAILAGHVYVQSMKSFTRLTTHALLIHFCFASSFLVGPFSSAAPTNPTRPGSHRVVRAGYKFPAIDDSEVLKGSKIEMWARVFRPADLSRPLPILFLLHGNHGTCGVKTATGTKNAEDCTYTYEGKCPSGFVVVPNHEGFNYFAETLASHGFIVVSINANRGITCGSGNDSDFGLNMARGKLVLRHIELWSRWAASGGAPSSLHPDANGFINRVDFNRIGLLGHSRAGEGMRAAHSLFNEKGSVWPSRIPNAKIGAIFEIGAVDGQTARTLDADNTAWTQLLPMCDGDVTELDGRQPFERMIRKRTELHPSPKALYMVWGANHNFFNSQWQESDSSECLGHQPIFSENSIQSAAQQKVATAAVSAFFQSTIGNGSADERKRLGETFNPLYPLPAFASGITRIDRDFIPSFDRHYLFNIDSFNFPTGKSSYGLDNLSNAVKVEHELDLPNRAKIEWNGPNGYYQTNWSKPGVGYDVSSLDSIDFRISRPANYVGNVHPSDFSIALADGADRLTPALPLSRYASALGPANAIVVYQTVRVPLRDFGLRPGMGVRGVRFIFDRNQTGSIYIANVHATGYYPSPAQLPAAPPSFELPVVVIPHAHPSAKRFPAQVVSQTRTRSPQLLNDSRAIEIKVRSDERFRPTAELPILVIGSQQFRLSRYDTPSDLRNITFVIPTEDFEALPESAEMRIQLGDQGARRIWDLPEFSKTDVR